MIQRVRNNPDISGFFMVTQNAKKNRSSTLIFESLKTNDREKQFLTTCHNRNYFCCSTDTVSYTHLTLPTKLEV